MDGLNTDVLSGEGLEPQHPLVGIEHEVGNAVRGLGLNPAGGLVLRDLICTHVTTRLQESYSKGWVVWTESMIQVAHILDLYLNNGKSLDGISLTDRKDIQGEVKELIDYMKLAHMLGLSNNNIYEDRYLMNYDTSYTAESLLDTIDERGALQLYRDLLAIATGVYEDTEEQQMRAYMQRKQGSN